MELKRHFSWRNILIGLYAFAFTVYIIVGLQPVSAKDYSVDAMLTIPDIGLSAEVTKLELVDGELKTPDTIAGSFARARNKTLIIGHSSTVFHDLKNVRIGNEINYNNKVYRIIKEQLSVKEVVKMNEILAPSNKDTLILMTCAGTERGDGDADYRLIITAVSE